MPVDYLPRAAIEGSHHGAIDTELKSLKLLSRRIQSVITAHLSELQILRRLFYKNKNQHHGALFWRNISEVRRYAERLQRLDILNAINSFRNTFYGKDNAFAGKGPWSHVPRDETMHDFARHCDVVLALSEKTSLICLEAYRMFHRSMQSGAFIQVLLMFVANSSRMCVISTEFVEIFTSVKSCITRLRAVAVVTESVCQAETSSMIGEIPVLSQAKEVKDTSRNCPSGITMADSLVLSETMADGLVVSETTADPTGMLGFNGEDYNILPEAPIILATKLAEELTIGSKRKKLRTGPENQSDGTKPVTQKKKKRRATKNEIDEIFGF